MVIIEAGGAAHVYSRWWSHCGHCWGCVHAHFCILVIVAGSWHVGVVVVNIVVGVVVIVGVSVSRCVAVVVVVVVGVVVTD